MEPDDIADRVEKIVAALVEARTSAGLSQYRLAELTGLSREAIRLIESGQRIPSLHTFLLLCAALEVDTAALFRDSDAS